MKVKVIQTFTGYGIRNAVVGSFIDIDDENANMLIYMGKVEVIEEQNNINLLSIEQLKVYANDNNIDLANSTKRNHILAKIKEWIHSEKLKKFSLMTKEELEQYAFQKVIDISTAATVEEIVNIIIKSEV